MFRLATRLAPTFCAGAALLACGGEADDGARAVEALSSLPPGFDASDPKADDPAMADMGVAVLPDAAPLTPDVPPAPVGVAVLGAGTHAIENVEFSVLATRTHGLRTPRALAFNPAGEGELWIVNRADDSTVTIFGLDGDNPQAEKRIDPYALHFMDNVSSIAFGAPMTFGTCQESLNTYNGMGPPNEFMGPSLWSADFDVYAQSNPEAVRGLGFDLGSHLDMLHESPLCMGIAWEADNIYWTFDGLTGSITRADFKEDHGVGWDDHSDGVMARYAEGEVARVEDVPSHMVFDSSTELLYIADTGNSRIAVLDTRSGRSRGRLEVKEPGTQLWNMVDAELRTLVAGEAGELSLPSGLVMHDGMLFVGDNETGRISAYLVTTGERVDYLETGVRPGGLMGLAFDTLGQLYAVDGRDNRLLRFSGKR